MSGCGFDSSSGHGKDMLDPPENSLRYLLSHGNSQNRVVLIFSQSWRSHSLEISATDDPRRAATKLTIKVCHFFSKAAEISR